MLHKRVEHFNENPTRYLYHVPQAIGSLYLTDTTNITTVTSRTNLTKY